VWVRERVKLRVRDPSLRRRVVILERSEESRGGLLKDDNRTRNLTRSRTHTRGALLKKCPLDSLKTFNKNFYIILIALLKKAPLESAKTLNRKISLHFFISMLY